MKLKYKLGIAAAILGAIMASAGSLKTWSTGEYITATDLNANLAHLHNSVGHGHGAVIVNADVSTSAAIAHSKLASPSLVPRAFVNIYGGACTSGTCSTTTRTGVTSVVNTGTAGTYTVTLSTTQNTAYYAVLITASGQVAATGTDGGTVFTHCESTAQTTTTITVKCRNSATGALIDSAFSLAVLDTGS